MRTASSPMLGGGLGREERWDRRLVRAVGLREGVTESSRS